MENLIERKANIKNLANVQNYQKCKELIKDNHSARVLISHLKNEDTSQHKLEQLIFDKNTDYATMAKELEGINKELHRELDMVNLLQGAGYFNSDEENK